MTTLERYSERYRATGGLAAEGIMNQLGRPNIEPLEVLVREAVQNCWDAKRANSPGIEVRIGRRNVSADGVREIRERVLPHPPIGLPLESCLQPGLQILHFADFGTGGLGGPTRADRLDGTTRNFVDFVRNVGQPPDKEFAGGSFGYGKAAFYIASNARTIVVDTLCVTAAGRFERRLIACALGQRFEQDGILFTGRHWWGRTVDGVPEPLIGHEADAVAATLGVPHREGMEGLGTTVAVIAPGLAPETDEDGDVTMPFIADALAWNFWPRMVSTTGGTKRTMTFKVTDDGTSVRISDPRSHERLRGFVEAMDRLRQEPGGDDDFILDRQIRCLSPLENLGRLVISKGVSAPPIDTEGPMPQGARDTAHGLHHVALMRNAELVVKYLRCAAPAAGRMGYSGAFRCSLSVDEAFRQAEPPTHDDWIHRAVEDRRSRSFVKVALDRIATVCREAAGYDSAARSIADGEVIPLGEFADTLAALMPGMDGPGARRTRTARTTSARRRRTGVARSPVTEAAADAWVEEALGLPPGTPADGASDGGDSPARDVASVTGGARPVLPAPQARPAGDPKPALAADGVPVLRYPFDLRANGNRVRLEAVVEVMTGDGEQVESDPPAGYEAPVPREWLTPAGVTVAAAYVEADADAAHGRWVVDVPIRDEVLMRVSIEVTVP